ncbi:hypothetical protein CsSME_00047254 [Camellia sinensis var. sinensis]
MATVSALGAEKPVVIFSKSGCCFCHTIKILIYGFGASLAVYELDELPNGGQLERELLSLGCRPSVPAVFIGGELVGGSNEFLFLFIFLFRLRNSGSCKSRVCSCEVESKEKSVVAVAAKQRWHDDRQWWQNQDQDQDHEREKRAHDDSAGYGFCRRKKIGCGL